MDSLILLMSFLPLYSPCFRLTFDITFLHPASSLSFRYSSLSCSSFLMFSAALSSFSFSFLLTN